MKSTARMRLLASSVAVVSLAASARADFINGYAWVTTEAISQNAAPASLALATCSHGTAACTVGNADVSFTTTGVNFPLQGSGTIATRLASSTFPLNNLVDSAPNAALDPTIWEFVGNISVTNGDTFTFGHDDGVTFIVNGQTVVNQPAPTGFVNTPGTYTGATNNNAPFQLIYGECCGGQAGLSVTLLGPGSAPGVPEPSSALLMGLGLAAIPLWRRRAQV
jgi:hypothetical protein